MRIITFAILLLVSIGAIADYPIYSEEKVRSIAEQELKKQKVKNYNFDDLRFNEEQNRWVVLYWQDLGEHKIRGIMVFVSNNRKPDVKVLFE